MKDEKDHVSVNNPDGASPPIVNDGKEKYRNDSPGAIRETSEQTEEIRYPETFDDPRNDETLSPDRDGADDYSTGASEVASQSAASVASSTAGFGALAGVVATAVVAAVIVVAAFISTLKVNLSLLLRDVDRLVFEIEMTGGQEEDFEEPIFAVLTSDDGTYMKREIGPDVRYLTFDGLEPGREYLIRIKNEHKEFVKKSFFTATVPNERGFIETFLDGNEVSVRVVQARLEAGEFYTLIAKNAAGNVLFTRDGVEPDAEYRFTISEVQNVYFSLSIGGMAVALSEIEVEPQPTPDTTETWSWSEDCLSATLTVSGTEVEATVTSEGVGEFSCETGGKVVYIATVEYGGKTYTDTQTVTYPAEGHYLENLVALVPAGCEKPGMAAHYQCPKCGALFDENKNPTDEASLTIPETGHAFSSLYSGYDADCENTGVAPHYFCENCDKVFDADKVETTADDLVIPALGHAYGDLVAEVPAGCDTDGTAAHYYCSACGKFFDADQNETTSDALVIAAPGHAYGDLIAATPAGCDYAGMAAHYQCAKCGAYFDENENPAGEAALIIPAIGHDYGDPIAAVPADCVTDGTAEHYECSACLKLFVYEGGEYVETERSDLAIPALGEMIAMNSNLVYSDGQQYRDRSVIFMTADKSATLLFGADNDTSRDVGRYSVFTILYVNSTPSIVLTYFDGETTKYLNNDGSGIVKFDADARDGNGTDQIRVTESNKIYLQKDSVQYYFVYDPESESILLKTDVSEVSEDKFVYMYVLPEHEYGELIPSTATCEEGGVAAHYFCSVCGKYFDENKQETTPAALAVSVAEHSYGDLIEEDANGNGLAAHYECSVCHKLFDEDKNETTEESLRRIKVTLNNVSSYIGRDAALQTQDGEYRVYVGNDKVAVLGDQSSAFTITSVDDYRVFTRYGESGSYTHINLDESLTTLTVNETYGGNYLEIDADGKLSYDKYVDDPEAPEPPEYITYYLMYNESTGTFLLSSTEVGPYVYLFLLPEGQNGSSQGGDTPEFPDAEPWSENDHLPESAGNYYLTQDVTLSETWNVPEGTTNLYLNGHGIIQTGGCGVMYVNEGVTLNLYDGNESVEHKFTLSDVDESTQAGFATVNDDLNANYQTFTGGYITGGYSSEYVAGPAMLMEGGTVTMNGGTILGNRGGSNSHCGAIQVRGTGVFTLTGGRIVYNKCAHAGAGVYDRAGGTLIITGGEISHNISTVNNVGGIATDSNGTLIISGDPIINNNAGGCNICLESKLILNGELTNTIPIAIKMNIDGQPTGVFTSGWSTYMGEADPNDYFTSSDGYSIRLAEGEVELGTPAPNISLNDGQLFINPDGYARSESDLYGNPTLFVSSAETPYLIQNQEIDWCDNIIQVYQTDANLATANIYIKLSNVTLEADSWASLFRIYARNTVNITLIIEGNVTFAGGAGQQIFSSQGSGNATVNIIIDQTTFSGTFHAEITDGLSYAESGTINVSYK